MAVRVSSSPVYIERKAASKNMGYTPYLKNKNIDNTRYNNSAID